MKYGRLTIIRTTGHTKWRDRLVECQCDCGRTKVVRFKCLTRGDTKSCGCLASEARRLNTRTHGMAGTPTYRCWWNMINRCHNPKVKSFADYGAKGVAVCERWKKFENFLADMGPIPNGLTIERHNNDEGYSKSNCCWADRLTQGRNRRNVHRITFNGKTLTLGEWAAATGIKRHTIHQRIFARGWPLERALSR